MTLVQSYCTCKSSVNSSVLRLACRGRGLGKSGKRKEGGGEVAPAIKPPIGSILQSLATAKFRLVSQTIGGVGQGAFSLGYAKDLRCGF